MDSFRRDEKNDDERSLRVFQNLDKTTLLMEAQYFNETPVDNRKCIHILTKMIYLLNQGEILSKQEASDLFNATTKLFQSKDIMLRRLLYLGIKELSSIAQNVIIVPTSLSKDVTGKEVAYRAAAIRTLCSITDSTTMLCIEHHMKQAIVDKNATLSSAALVSALHLSGTMPDLVRYWGNEAQEGIMSDNAMVSYHALGLVAEIVRNDRIATATLVTKLINFPLRSPYAICLLIRHAAKLANEDETEESERYVDFIESCLRHTSEIVNYEAAYTIVNLKKPPKDLTQAVSIIQMFCGSPKITLRLAGVRTLVTLIVRRPDIVSACAVHLENLISDPNRFVATLAVTTLLATGEESSINRLMKKINDFWSEISDELKIMVVETINDLFKKYPRKHKSLSAFLFTILRDNGGNEYKAAIVDALIGLMEENPDVMETGLSHLCEFIEDCAHQSVALRILHLLGREGSKIPQLSKYIRFAYNRILLDSAPVRAAALKTLALFGATREELLPDIIVLLARCHLDDDDEVRDRAIFFGEVLDSGDRQQINDYIVNVNVPNLVILEKELIEFLEKAPDAAFDISSIPVNDSLSDTKEKAPQTDIKEDLFKEFTKITNQLKVVPGIEKLGRLLKTCIPLDLTEAETEYRVSCTKHIFPRHIILQFQCLNTLNDQFLENVYINLQLNYYYKGLTKVACERLTYGRQENVFYLLKFPDVPIETLCSMKATMEFIVRDCDPITGLPFRATGYADTYCLDKVVIGCPEQFRNRAAVVSDDWEEVWIKASAASEVVDRFSLPKTDINEGAKAVCHVVGLPIAAIRGDTVLEIKGGGLFREGTPMLIRAQLQENNGDVNMFFSCRSPRVEVATLVVGAVCS